MIHPVAPNNPANASLGLLLASGSPRRRELLDLMGLAHRVCPPDVVEWEAVDADPASLVRYNAALKADAVSREHPHSLVLAADTTVALVGEVLNKPADLDEARSMLRRLAGQTHTVFTGVSLRHGTSGKAVDFVETSEVRFKAFDDATIASYFALVNPLDKAGAYGIQEGRDLIIAGWEGSLHNIMGLPTERLREVFEQEGWWPVLVESE